MAKQSKQQKTSKARPGTARPRAAAAGAVGGAAEQEMDRLRAAREGFVARLGERMTAVRDGKMEPELPEAARDAQIDRVRQRIERRKAARDEVVARIDEEIRRDEKLITDLERQARPETDKGGGKGSGKTAGGKVAGAAGGAKAAEARKAGGGSAAAEASKPAAGKKAAAKGGKKAGAGGGKKAGGGAKKGA